jgi:steroid Delta-isomerase
MPDEATRKEMALEYARRMNAGDVEGVLEMFSDDVVFEDPVGSPPLIGKDALRQRISWSIGCKVHEIPGRAVTSMDERWVVVPSTVSAYMPNKVTFTIIGVMEVGDDGLTRHVKAFWGVTDARWETGPEAGNLAMANAAPADAETA